VPHSEFHTLGDRRIKTDTWSCENASGREVSRDLMEPTAVLQCSAHSKRSGERCRRWAMSWATLCATHGGKAPQVVAKARMRLLEHEARVLLERLGNAQRMNPW
jgi:hypothetical protein